MLKDKYKELLKEQKEERIKLKKEIEIQDLISCKTSIPFRIYISNLYNCDAFITFKLSDGTGLNKKEINQLIENFKPIDCFLCGGNAFKPFIEKEDKDKSQIKINPYYIKYDGFDSSVFIEWYSKIKGKAIHIKAKVNNELKEEILSVSYERVEFKGDFRIDNTRINILGNFDDGKYKYIRWAKGTEHYPNDFTIYTEDLETDFQDYLNT